MRRLYLIRHAKSSWGNADLEDYDRPLNQRGERDAPLMGKRLKKYNVEADLVISSPAKRALKTAKIIVQEINYPANKIVTTKKLYEAGVTDMMNVINKIDNKFKNVLLFGHNPGLTTIAYYLTKHSIDNIPTCGIFCMDFKRNWAEISEGSGIFAFFDYPKKHHV